MTTVDAPAATLQPVLDEASVVVCCGSGGVGKTTVAAAFGVEAARRGRRVVVVTIDPAKRLADALGVDELGSEPQPIDLAGVVDDPSGELWAMMLDTAAAFNAVVRRYAPDPEQADRIVANAFFRNMAGSLSGTQEYMAAETLHLLAGDERFDLVVVDTPPTRSALDFLAAPGVLARFLDHRLFKLLMLPARPGMRMISVATQPVLRAIGKVVGTAVLADAVAFFQAFAGMESGFRQRADDVIALLRAPSTVFLLVAAPRREAVAEAAWFAGQLADQDIDNIAGVANRVHCRRSATAARLPPTRLPSRRTANGGRCGATWPSCGPAAHPSWRRSASSSTCSPARCASTCRNWPPTSTTATASSTSAATSSATG